MPDLVFKDVKGNIIQRTKVLEHDVHYYRDGNIVFAVENQVFRVYRDILTRRSSVMRDMFEVGSEGPQDAAYDGVPAVVLHDRARDFALLLNFIYPVEQTVFSLSAVPMTTCIDISLIADKYGVEDLRTWAVARLESELPKNADTLAKLAVYRDIAVAVRVVEMLSHQDLGSEFLPYAYYALATSKAFDDVSTYSSTIGTLSPDVQARINVGRANLMAAVMNIGNLVGDTGLSPTAVTCPVGRCGLHRPSHWTGAAKDAKTRYASLQKYPLEELRARISWDYKWLCEGLCRNTAKATLISTRDIIIQRLPKIFGLKDSD